MNGVTRRVGDLFKSHKNIIIMMKAMRMLLDVTRDRAEIGLYKKNDDDDVDGMVDSARVA